MLTGVYHSLPVWARSAAASGYGYYLNLWRYGWNTEKYVREAFDREQWDSERTAAYQSELLQKMLRRAATVVPYYRSMWSARRSRGDNSRLEDLNNWPLLDKDEVRNQPRAFVAEDCSRLQLFRTQTSGTTGKPMELWQTRQSLHEWYGLMEARWRRWYGVSKADRWAILGGQLVAPITQNKPPFWIWNNAFQQLYMSSYHLSDALIPSYFEALRRYRVSYILGYTSALYSLAKHAATYSVPAVRLKVAITNAEPLSSVQRNLISSVFDCPVRETYGMSEMVAAASECEHGSLHLWPRAGIVEVFSGSTALPHGETGELVCTGLLNDAMPLIRYRIGDRGALSPQDQQCACGRNLPALKSLEGRMDDVLYTSSGAEVGRLDPVFKADLPVREVQIVQRSLSEIELHIVPDPGWTHAAADRITERLRLRMGDVHVMIRLVDSIARGPNGKFRAVICEIPRQKITRGTRTHALETR